MKFSIIIPIYNVEPFLREGIESIINQSYKDLEIVCVNDGSTDNCLQILQEYALRDQRICVISQENQGTYIARQVGVSTATGDYIIFFDPDDWLELDACEKIASFIKTNDADIIQYGVDVDGSIEGSVTAEWLEKWLNSEVDSLVGSDLLWTKCYVEQKIAWNLIGKVVKTAIAKQGFGMQNRCRFSTLTDYFAAYYLYAYAKTYKRLELRLYHYRHGVGVSTKKDVTLKDFQSSIKNFNGLTDLLNFVSEHEKAIGDVGCFVARNVMKSYVINNALFFALNRLPRSIDAVKWFKPLEQLTDVDDIIRCIVKNLNDTRDGLSVQLTRSETLEKIIASKETHIVKLNEIYEQNIDEIQQLQKNNHIIQKNNQLLLDQIKTLSNKNEKHLKQLRTLILLYVVMLIGLLISLLV